MKVSYAAAMAAFLISTVPPAGSAELDSTKRMVPWDFAALSETPKINAYDSRDGLVNSDLVVRKP